MHKKSKNEGKRELILLLPEKEVCIYFLKIKTTSSHKVIYFKR